MTVPIVDDAGAVEVAKSRWRRVSVAAAVAGGLLMLCVAVGVAVSAAHRDPGATLSGSPLVGRLAPQLAGATVTGGHASLAGYRGRWVVVNFFGSWCVPCEAETAELVRFATAHRGPADPAILGVVYEDDDASVRHFLHRHHVTWPLLSYAGIDAANAYGVAGIPVTFLVGPDDRVAAKIVGGLRTGQLDTLLADAQAKRTAVAAGPSGSAGS